MWFRRDLRTDDSPALAAAAAEGDDGVVPLFVVDPRVLAPVGPNRRRFLAGSLRQLDRQLGGRLVLRRGDPAQVVPAVAGETGAAVVYATADFGPYGRKRDRAVANVLAAEGRVLKPVSSAYLVPPGMVRAQSGVPLRIFGPYRRAWELMGWGPPVPVADVRYLYAPSTTSVDDIERGVAGPGQAGLPPWWEGLPMGQAQELPPPGPGAAMARLDRFVEVSLPGYARARENPGADGTSRLSPYLHFGCVHPRTVLDRAGTGAGPDRLRTELAWRDFYADVLWHQPCSAHRPLQEFGRHLRWDDDARSRERFRAWATGRTGFPLVDAAMRQLLAEGWVHNRARMVAASFLVKDLHIDWRLGARWFLWHLVDGDLASNQHGWQWVAGTGTDAAPFHRIFNPGTQMERFDPEGTYVRRYLDEGTGPAPSLAGPSLRGPAYPAPVVDHARERREALARFDLARRAARVTR
jgi:deoxyribodipyrimidine photo-lyase